ncbi:MAG TPA: sugar transferase [Bryobacteraceae bacterium]|nr:sugar transferase [Bryobacteraceae bacterium]
MRAESSLPLLKLLDVVLIAAGFGAAILAYSFFYPDNYAYLTSDEVLLGFVTDVCTVWVGFQLLEATGDVHFIDLLLVGTGLDLIAQALLNYFALLTRSLFLIVAGVLVSAMLLSLAKRWLRTASAGSPKGILMVGFDPLTQRLASSLGQPVLGMLGDASACPAGIPHLGEEGELEDVMERKRPAYILVSDTSLARISPSILLAQRLRGVMVRTTPGLYESQLQRIYCRGSQPVDLLLSPALSPESRILAIQAIYTNLLGLVLLIVLSPVLFVVSLAVALFSGAGPVFETVECSGFRNIPFLLLRFRTRRSGKRGGSTWIGSLICRWHLVNLPQLFNVVRGEMALFGPRPVRREFAQRLTEIMPFYAMRLSVKPGLIGWAQRPTGLLFANELTQIEYDLYYVKHNSPQLDVEILMRMFFGGTLASGESSEAG